MSTLNKTTASQLSRELFPTHITTEYCKRCDRETRWAINLLRSYFRCLECDTPLEETPSKQE